MEKGECLKSFCTSALSSWSKWPRRVYSKENLPFTWHVNWVELQLQTGSNKQPDCSFTPYNFSTLFCFRTKLIVTANNAWQIPYPGMSMHITRNPYCDEGLSTFAISTLFALRKRCVTYSPVTLCAASRNKVTKYFLLKISELHVRFRH